ncbi:MAG: hypothetical protein V9G20_19200 [Candidatus Promineifilaceae bacterium]
MKTMEFYRQDLRQRKEISLGTAKEAETQHKKGRLTARERINQLF